MSKLTKRQRQVLELKAQGLTYRGIARQLGISPRTAEMHADLARRATNSTTFQLAVAVAVEAYKSGEGK